MSAKKSWMILVLVLVIAAAGAYAFVRYTKSLDSVSTSTPTATSAYQAVFLVNNQVYFGKLHNERSQYPELTDIYYLQVNQTLQPAQGKTTSPDVSLVKLGGELHGPVDSMKINRDHILLIEDLRADSNVVKAIEDYQKKQAAAQTQ